MKTAGYSCTPLVRKLWIAAGARLTLLDAPPDFDATLGTLPDGVSARSSLRGGVDVAICFVTSCAALARRIEALGRAVFPDGAAWVAWPKHASGVPTDMTEDAVRQLTLSLGLIDNKVCAIDETWSGLLVVWRKELRGASAPRHPAR